ncbi:hypothetical protein L6E12_31460 [Actinokineospora sp. PR83]|uniref:hypothetical protein n=1 Tax=Actinokineospora sp. PR83 TaxID=2884908 RepID=UPI001F163677|nr:hypothetical protein [Actinokineospora sp. PR83]MCG8920297.1 hypothetical protein [Actinokineospora sp. PR83]
MSQYDYEQMIADLKGEVHELTALRNGQESGSDTHAIYQRRITDRTRVLLALEVSLDVLADADDAVAAAGRELRRVEAIGTAESQRAARAAWALLWPGLVGLAASTLIDLPWWVVAASVTAGLAAAVLGVRSVRTRPALAEHIDTATAAWQQAAVAREEMWDRVRAGQPALTADTTPAATAWPVTR